MVELGNGRRVFFVNTAQGKRGKVLAGLPRHRDAVQIQASDERDGDV